MPDNIRKIDKADKTILEETFDYGDLELNFYNIQSILGTNSDFLYKQVFIANNRSLEATIIYIDGMVNNQLISDYVLKPLMEAEQFKHCSNEYQVINAIEEGSVYYISAQKRTDINTVMSDLLSGSTAVLFDRQHLAFTFEVKGFEKRSIEMASGESAIKSSKDSFTETLRSNTATCRRKIKSPNLVMEETIVGKQTKTSVSICYMKNIVNDKLLNEVKARLDEVNTENAITPGFIEEFLVDSKTSIFPQIQYTERSDRFCHSLLDGRVGLIIDGLPVSYIIPGTLLQFVQAPEDYSQHFIMSSATRYLRFTSMFITLLLPAFFISITTFHQEMLPSELSFSIIASKEGVPFPIFVEVLFMLVAFELLVEAGLRLPQTIGQTVSIVGAVVVGQSAVQAKLLSPATVVIISITAIAGFTMPNQDLSNALRVWRFLLTIFACIIGMFGLTMGLIIMIYQWCKIDTFGVPYLSPFVGDTEFQLKDTLFRFPHTSLKERPKGLKQKNKRTAKQGGQK